MKKFLEDQIVHLVKQSRQSTKEILAVEDSSHDYEIEKAKDKIQRTESLIKRAELDAFMTTLLKSIWHWPSWITRNDFTRFVPARIQVNKATQEKGKSGESKQIEFEFSQRIYTVTFTDEDFSLEDFEYAKIRLEDNNGPLFAFDVSRRFSDEYYDWKYSRVTYFKPGIWMSDLAVIYELLVAKEKANRQDLEDSIILEQAASLFPSD